MVFVQICSVSELSDGLILLSAASAASMTSQYRRSFATCILLACWSCPPCVGFLGSLPRSAAVGRAHRQRSFQKHERVVVSTSAKRRTHSHSSGATTRHRTSSAGLLGMVAAPADLWQSYLGALDTAPLLSKVGRPLTWIPSYRFFFERTLFGQRVSYAVRVPARVPVSYTITIRRTLPLLLFRCGGLTQSITRQRQCSSAS